ncbi:hypothetical protein H8356DRAFT_1010954 [Neocallimastix lanati (nom. inval.)]|jgi:hypothetical protein|uniref:Rho-GAP domain-containing protein n=1 Tax=Neocallimastix californiae TaxID=1754190 RepID=A0A1Y2FB81_9FUNG|nr:hypothetical protein H8356DRAFT_1010954 [Neocallimastix sp. JGI-2020a]ORY80596.1 hypothetical protein LY90DRAFT_664463 [Neocallimastix californiae]|eukprot:ORY80596.1 hypothetical protein LY90DRAFT_664463 [Neocallimastix californiae]
MLQKHFTDCFWAYDTKDTTIGIRTINKKIEKGFNEVDELISFVKKRISLEENYSYDLVDLGQSRNYFEETAEEGSSVYQSYVNIKRELINYGNSRQNIANAMKEYVLNPLIKYQDTYRKYSHKKTQEIIDLVNTLQKQKDELEYAKAEYYQSCEISEQFNNLRNTIGTPYYSLDNMDFPALDAMIPIGPRNMTIEELNSLLLKMQHEIPQTTVSSWIGNYQAMAGEDIVRFMMKRFLDMSKDDAIMAAQDLLKMGFIGTRSISKQPFSFNGSYVWKKTTMEGEAPHKKAKRDVERTDYIYKNAVKTVETTRCNIECEMYAYLVKVEDIEYQRIQTIRSSVAAMIDLESKSVMVNQVLYDHDKLFLETIQPERDLNQVINQCRTGTTHIPVTIYESYYYSPGHFQTFGVFLDQLVMSNGTNVPIIVKKCLSAITKTVKALCENQEIVQEVDHEVKKLTPVEMERRMWLGPRPFIGQVYELRNQLNTQKITLKILKNFKVPVIIAVLKLFLQELPISLIAGDMYESFKMLYSGAENNDLKNRVTSIERLLYTLSPPYYETLACIMKHLHGLVEDLPFEDEFISGLSYSIAHLILRPWTESIITINDKHASRLVKDLIYYYNDIFPERFTLARNKMSTKAPQRPVSEEIAPAPENADDETDKTQEVLATIDKATSTFRASLILEDNAEQKAESTLEGIEEKPKDEAAEPKPEAKEEESNNDTLKSNETAKDISEIEDKSEIENEIIEKTEAKTDDVAEKTEETKVEEAKADETKADETVVAN